MPKISKTILSFFIILSGFQVQAATQDAEFESATYLSPLKMREKRKLGAGMSVGGGTGVVGFNVELNFEDADGAIAGFGTGPGYQAVQIAWKHAFDGDYLAPYTVIGYSHWYNPGNDNNNLKNSDILSRVLTAAEKASGQFGADFINAAAGLQYNQLSGDLVGFSVYTELMAMWEVKRSQVIPTGSVGALYYF